MKCNLPYQILGQAIASAKLSLPGLKLLPNSSDCVPGVLVGDEALPLSTYLMRPYSRIALTKEKRIFNYRLSRARYVMKRYFVFTCSKLPYLFAGGALKMPLVF